MARPQAPGFAARAELRARSTERRARARRLHVLWVAIVAAAVAVSVAVLAFDSAETTEPVPVADASRLLPAGPPTPQVVALHSDLRVYLPVNQPRVTAIGYFAAGQGALGLEPVGTQANAGVFTRLFRKLFGQDRGAIRYYLLGGESGPETSGLAVGAPVGTDVYAPVDGTVIGITPRYIDGEQFGVQIDIQAAASPSLVVSLTNLDPDEALTIGSTVAAARTKMGTVLDLSSVQSSALAEHTQDSGQYVLVEVRSAARVALQ
ncbi:MAG: hypothetical protein U0R69_05840 [Gaiellales bacterium]